MKPRRRPRDVASRLYVKWSSMRERDVISLLARHHNMPARVLVLMSHRDLSQPRSSWTILEVFLNGLQTALGLASPGLQAAAVMSTLIRTSVRDWLSFLALSCFRRSH